MYDEEVELVQYNIQNSCCVCVITFKFKVSPNFLNVDCKSLAGNLGITVPTSQVSFRKLGALQSVEVIAYFDNSFIITGNLSLWKSVTTSIKLYVA